VKERNLPPTITFQFPVSRQKAWVILCSDFRTLEFAVRSMGHPVLVNLAGEIVMCLVAPTEEGPMDRPVRCS
jgi:hypothetical protein